MDARKRKIGPGDLEALFDGATEVVLARGKSFDRYDPSDADDWAVIAEKALGRSGNLRAPAARSGKRWLVGWSDAAWDEIYG